MSILFTPHNIGKVQVKNRFIFSACEDNAASETGMITDAIMKKNLLIAKGETGMIISTHMSVHPEGRTRLKQAGIQNDETIPGLKKLTETVHEYDAKIVFQLGHAGVQGLSGIGPSGEKTMNEDAIHDVIESFIAAAVRAAEAGADGVQVHAAHGYLLSEFLSPFYNKRTDNWGGSEENCFRIMEEIITGIKKILPENMILMVKMNSNDFTPEEGITQPLAVNYARCLAALGIDAVEVSCGTSLKAPWNMCRGEIPIKEMLNIFPEDQKPVVEKVLTANADNFKLYEGYNLDAAKAIRPVAGKMVVFPVGGWRKLRTMEDAVTKGDTEFISFCRPLIKEPLLVKHFREGKSVEASCTSCNRCLAALGNKIPVRCYINGF